MWGSLRASALFFGSALAACSTHGGDTTAPSDAAAAVDAASPDGTPSCSEGGAAPAPLAYVVAQPARQGLWVLDASGEPDVRQVLVRTLQGVVNRAAPRIYVVDDVADPKLATDSQSATRFWLSIYQNDLGITATGSGTLDDALRAFASEIPGYYLVSADEPWTFNAATTAAATKPGVAVAAADAPALEALGIHQLESFVGRWPDATSCYQELAQRAGQMPHPGFAVLNANKERPRDFFIQQGMLTLGGYQQMPEWAGDTAALSHVAPATPLFGYTARDGFEELDSVTQISKAGDVLIATDSTPNLSFHVAVAPKTKTLAAPADTNVDCGAAALNVVIGLTDGDNLVTETTLYPTANYWLSAQRGTIPISWSISPALASVAPAVLDYYVRTVASGDELVEMIGAGYAYASQMPNGDWFYALSVADAESIGLRVLWSFDPWESGGGTYTWQPQLEKAVACGRMAGLLDGYYPSPFHAVGAGHNEIVGDVPVLRAVGSYSDGPADIAKRVGDLLALPSDQRPPVVFYSASAWTNDVPGLVAALAPLKAQGVRFLSASAGLHCLH